jgi:catechol 2,3-dioxygenase-like lactoylglutathione lyase family enzyme
MTVDGLHHVAAITADIDANLEFYGQLLGSAAGLAGSERRRP